MRLRDEFAFRMYTAAQFRRLLASVPSLEFAGCYDFWYEIDNPMDLNDERTDTVFVLRKRRCRAGRAAAGSTSQEAGF